MGRKPQQCISKYIKSFFRSWEISHAMPHPFWFLWHVTPTSAWEENKFPNASFGSPPTDLLEMLSSVLKQGWRRSWKYNLYYFLFKKNHNKTKPPNRNSSALSSLSPNILGTVIEHFCWGWGGLLVISFFKWQGVIPCNRLETFFFFFQNDVIGGGLDFTVFPCAEHSNFLGFLSGGYLSEHN